MDPVDEKKPGHVVFIPFPAQSHIKCMLKLARLLHQKGLYVTFINTQTNHELLVNSGGLEDAPGFWFKTVPDGLGSATDHIEPTRNIGKVMDYLGTSFFDSFLDLVSGVKHPVTCIVCDGFMTFTNTVRAAEKLKIPIMLFWTMAACGFMAFYQAKVLMEKQILPLKDEVCLTNGCLDMEIDWIPGMKGIRLKDLPEFIRTTRHDDHEFIYILETAKAADEVPHMIIHTFEELEASLVSEIKSIFPNVYTIGPLQLLLNQITEKHTKKPDIYSLWKEEPECVRWLKSKEANSVVYVNFGSLAVMSAQDLLEFGWGLVNSNHYFIWIIRTNLVDGKPTVLPQELKEAMNKKGFVGSWCSQEEVLNHPAVGGFLTHCGWGSIIESLSAGVPMLCWPSIGDQRTNCRQMFKEWELGMEIGTNVKRDQVEKRVRALMKGLEGERMRRKALEWKKMAEIVAGSDGSSHLDVERLVNEIDSFGVDPSSNG
ncbi:hypothetical protein L1987_55944 [Smallanthus sonchifolius]|uniref:Uncharacterized protein n=1 Tax=Smallanthus sonchifolius TaxID=185202 RepID=A0ACB9EBQ9_9ASTR|nr:hypothetical protein L1987_55944 [Smallanthus sonchifolius]